MNHNATISVSQRDDIEELNELNQQSDLGKRATRQKSIFFVVEQQFVRYIFIHTKRRLYDRTI